MIYVSICEWSIFKKWKMTSMFLGHPVNKTVNGNQTWRSESNVYETSANSNGYSFDTADTQSRNSQKFSRLVFYLHFSWLLK